MLELTEDVDKVDDEFTEPIGITNPPIDDLLEKTHSKYALAVFAAKRAREINSYFNQLIEGVMENIGPLVNYAPQEKPLSIAMREVNKGVLDLFDGNEVNRKKVTSAATSKKSDVLAEDRIDEELFEEAFKDVEDMMG